MTRYEKQNKPWVLVFHDVEHKRLLGKGILIHIEPVSPFESSEERLCTVRGVKTGKDSHFFIWRLEYEEGGRRLDSL